MKNSLIKTIKLMQRQTRSFKIPAVTEVSWRKDPYLVLVSCILSLRTKDKTTDEACAGLFKAANTPKKMTGLSQSRIQRLIYPVGFYRNKAKVILEISRRLIQESGGKVPNHLEDLLGLRGVGLKTANLVLGLGYGIPAICVDTHVHRISNRLGWAKTKAPEDTEEALREVIPEKYWIDLNTTMVTFGQNICFPVSPFCSRCSVYRLCKRRGVNRWR